jgi:ABC-2 type transport system permease protein
MAQATSSEWLKFTSLRSTLYTLLATFVLSVGLGALFSYARGSGASRHGLDDVFDPTRVSLQGFSIAEIAIGVIGVLIITSEYSSGSIRSTLAATPRRLSVLSAKTAVLFASTLVFGELCAFTAFLIGQAILRGQHANSSTLSSPGALRAVLLAGLSLPLLAVFAMGIGTMLRHTAGAVTLYVGLTFVAVLLVLALPNDWQQHVSKFLPEILTGSMRAASTTGAAFTSFSAVTSTFVLAGYALASFLAGAVLLQRRDA